MAEQVLGRAAILAVEDLQVERVPVPEWGGVVILRGLSGRERDQFEAENARRAGNAGPAGQERALQNIRARLVVRCIVGEDGERVFQAEDADALGAKSGKVLDRLFDVAAALSGITEQNVKDLAEGF